MEIILLERIEKLGQIGEVVHVKDGYARNYLLPQKKALRATEANRLYFEAQKKEIEARNAQQVAAAKKVADKVKDVSIIILRQAGESGQLYGSVTSRDIARAIREKGVKEVRRGNVVLDSPIKELGIVKVHIRLHGDVIVDIDVNIARTAEEAEAQVLEAEKIFETEELAKAAEAELAEAPEEEEAEEEAEEAAAEGEEATEAEAAKGEKVKPKEAKAPEKKAKEDKKAKKAEKKAAAKAKKDDKARAAKDKKADADEADTKKKQ